MPFFYVVVVIVVVVVVVVVSVSFMSLSLLLLQFIAWRSLPKVTNVLFLHLFLLLLLLRLLLLRFVLEEFLSKNSSQLGSYFGHAVCFADLNGDGLDDAVISAPLHRAGSAAAAASSNRASSAAAAGSTPLGKSSTEAETGAVFVYLQRKLPLGASSSAFPAFHAAPIILTPPKLQHPLSSSSSSSSSSSASPAWFGHSLTSLGDIDNDGFEDIAVGAPFGSSGSGSGSGGGGGGSGSARSSSGVVLIYRGSKSGVDETPQQILEPTDFGVKLTSFGFSLAGSQVNVFVSAEENMAPIKLF